MIHIGSLSIGDFPLILSPMDDVTDHPFRELCRQMGADVVVTEFIASEALNREVEKSRQKMCFSPQQRPVGIQIFGADEASLLKCIDIVAAQHPDFIDLNWGCPVKKVAGKGAGAGMLNDLPRLLAITEAVVRRSPLPVTVKTRLGYDNEHKPIVALAEALQDVGVAALSIHGRTKTQMYKGVADWTLIGEVKNNPRMHIPIFGNGDLTSPEKVLEAKRRYGVDGVLIGRGAIGNPWIFEQTRQLLGGAQPRPVPISERCQVCRTHLLEEVAFKGEHRAVFEMRKHYGGYFYGLKDFRQFRLPLVSVTSVEALLPIFDQIAAFYG